MTLCDCTDHPQLGSACICHSAADAIQALASVRRALEGTYTAAGTRIWLHAANARLNSRSPMSLIMAGRGQEAVDEARRVGAS